MKHEIEKRLKADAASATVKPMIDVQQSKMMTVADLLAVLEDVPPSTWVCLYRDGPLMSVEKEIGANEPFVLLCGPATVKP